MPAPPLRDRLLARLDNAILELISAYDEYATLWETEKKERAHQTSQAMGGGWSQSAVDSWVSVQTVDHSSLTVRAGQTIKALEAELDYLKFRIDRCDVPSV